MIKLHMRILIVSSFVLWVMAIASCAPREFAKSNKEYKRKASEFSKTIKAQPDVTVKTDSSFVNGQWIGTVNFGLRRPNFVIIHHTAQQSCEKTLQAFTKKARR
jgi:N-acetylmuramoyl-L-alanine amidase